MNTQPVEGRTTTDLIEIVGKPFYTIQGEGPLVGTPAVFVRTAGCNLSGPICPLCDTDYTSDRRSLPKEQILEEINHQRAIVRTAVFSPFRPLVVITGGEPFRQNIVPLIDLLLDEHFSVQIETNGTQWRDSLPLYNKHFTIVCSPKTEKINPLWQTHLDHYKYVLQADFVDPDDGLPLSSLGRKCRVARPFDTNVMVYVQPADENDRAKDSANLRAAIDSCMTFGYRLSLQTHKFLNLP